MIHNISRFIAALALLAAAQTARAQILTINTADDWNTFASNVNGSANYSGLTVTLGADITVTATVGTKSKPFTGTFDGNGKTLTVNIDETSTQEGTAPFRYISGGAVIRNLTVAGSVTGTNHAAGLVGFSEGGTSESPNTIENCTVSTSVSGGTHNGGVVGHGLTSYLKIKNTVFSGSIANGSRYMGGLQGWSEGNHLTIDNCIFKGSYSGSGSFHPIAIHNSGSTTTANVSGAYYTAAPTLTDADKIAATGTQVSTSAPSDVVYGSVIAADNQTYYAPVTVSGINNYYFYTGNEIAIDYTVTAADGTSLTKDTHYTGTISPATVKDKGEYILTLTGTGSYSGSQTFRFTVGLDWATENQGTSADPYMIYNKDQLLLLAHRVNGTNGETANDYSGKYFKLGADITFSHAAVEGDDYAENYEAIGGYLGGYTYRHFRGNFNGDNKTVSGIRIRKTGDGDADSYQGLFGMISGGGTIHDVHLTDARIKSYYYVGGIVGYNNSSTVSGCTVTDSYITATKETTNNYGTICGWNRNGTLRNNYYHGCTVNGTAVTSGKGCQGADITANNGALPAYRLALGENITTPPGTFVGQTEWLDTPPVNPRLAPENGFTLAGNHYFASGYVFTPGSTLASGAAQGYTPRATLGDELLDLYTPTDDNDLLAGTAIARLTITADCDGKTLASTEAIYSTGQPVTVAYIKADGTPGEASAIALDGMETSLAEGWYFVGKDISYDATLTLGGDVTLILKDGCTMNVGTSEAKISGHGIARESGGDQALTIYGQNAGTGALNVYTDNGNRGIVAKAVTINGGNVTIDANGNDATGIYAGDEDITINGGNVSVTAPGTNAWAIYAFNRVTINGGTVEASGNADGIRIDNGTIAINGGTVNASGDTTGDDSGYGINASYGYGTITLGWSKPTDRITASSYSSTVAVKDGQALTDGSGNIYTGTLTDEQKEALAGKTLQPAVLAQYIDANGQSAEHTALILDGTETTLTAGWYYVGKDIAYTQTLRLTADATLILADGCTMSINPATPGKGIDGYNDPDEDASLTIYGQTQGSGTLAIATTGVAGPNGWDGTLGHAIHVKDYTQHSGTVTLRTSGAHAEGLTANGNVTINGGTADITAAATASNGINSGGHVTISGGRVTANAADDDYDGILVMGDATLEGGKCVYIPKNVTITGGIVDASSIAAYWGGDITLGWTSPADCITVGNYKLDDGDDASPDGSVKIADGQALCAPGGTIYTGTLGSEQIAAINGRELTPICLLTESDGVSKLAGQANVPVIFTRSGLTANAYSTMCLPFGFEKPNNCTFYAFKGVGWSDANNQWEATISETSTLAAHTPYIFKCSDTEATFIGTIASVPTDIEASLVEVGASEGDDTNWKFKGTYTALDWKSANPSEPTYGFSTYVPVEQGNTENIAAGTFVRFVQGASLAPFRARLIYSGSNEHLNARGHSRAAQAESELPRYIIVRIIGADGTATAIGTLDTTTGQLSTDEWYTLGGRRLEAKPNAKGIYIHNGRKVIVK